MQITDERAASLKTWITKKLENISDADSDVLADYVLALLRAESTEEALRQNLVESLEDFLKDHTASFVAELFQAVAPQRGASSHGVSVASSSPSEATRTAYSDRDSLGHGAISRKRTYSGMSSANVGAVSLASRRDRQLKSRRGAGRASSNRVPQPHQPPFPSVDLPNLPFDPYQAAAAMFTLQSMGVPVPPLFENALPSMSPNSAQALGDRKSSQRCRDYAEKGICRRGAHCPYSHDENQIILPAPTNGHGTATSSKIHQSRATGASPRREYHDRAQAHERNSASGDLVTPSGTTIVVAQIPEPHLNEDAVQSHFSIFGTIQSINVSKERSQAHVTYETYAAAQAAYDSPKVIFDNRFVKVYFHRSRYRGAKSDTSTEPVFDPEAFAASTAAAQARLEQRRELKKETEAKLAEIAQKQVALFTERRRLEEELRKKNGADVSASASSTDALRAQLHKLEQEAKNLGLDPEPWAPHRGGFRGRGSFRGRGAAGMLRGPPRAGAYNLDNRPKRVAIKLEDEGEIFDSSKEEALRQHLFTVAEFTAISMAGDGSQTITFKDRPAAERFFYGKRDIPGLGKVEMSWVREENANDVLEAEKPRDDTNGGSETKVNGDDVMQDLDNRDRRDGIDGLGGRDERDERDLDWGVAEDEGPWVR